MKEMPESEFTRVVEETRLRLQEKSEWRERYAGYAKNISDNSHTIKKVRRAFMNGHH